MFDHKKITAFLAALLMGVSAVTASCPAVYAENETELTAEDSGEDIAPVQESPKLTARCTSLANTKSGRILVPRRPYPR